jgi:tetratricopeptide (TPR) repeat protein
MWDAAFGVWVRWSPLGLALAVFLMWAALDGGYVSVKWLPGTIFVLGLAVIVAVGEGRPLAGRPLLAAASLFFAAFTAWSFLSIAWADVKGDAWDGANRTLLYLCVFVLFASRPVPARIGTVLLSAFVLATAAIGTVEFLRVVQAHRLAGFFIEGRLSTPISYPNANAALFLAPFLPAVYLASRREIHPVLRGALLACAGLLLELATMCQSRASLVALPLTILVFLAIAPGRLRSLLALAAVATPVALGAGRLLHVYAAVVGGHEIQPALTQARSVLAWSALALFLGGIVIALIDRRVRVPARATRAIGAAVTAGAVVAAVAAVPLFVGRYGDPLDRAQAAWHEFKTDKPTESTYAISNHLSSGFASSRYDVWRVALDEFKAAPIAGVGVDNFAADYLRLRRTNQEPMHQHSVELRVLAQTGLVGTLLFAGFLGAALLAAARSLQRRDPHVSGLAAACLAVFAYWLIHGSVDWFWEVPALGAPAFAWLAVAGQTVPRDPPGARNRLPFYARLPLVLVAAVAAVGLAIPWVAAKEIETASASWAADPATAFRRLDLARQLNPLTDNADVVAGVIASRLHDRPKERAAFVRAIERNPHNWYARFELALVDARQGKTAAALAQLRLAGQLNPREPVIPDVRKKILHRKPVSEAAINRLFLERTEILTGVRQR